MSYELVLVAGPADDGSRRRRGRRIQQAAQLLPGALPARVVETPWVTAALIETEPLGGCSAELTATADDLEAVIAMVPGGIQQARSPGARELGAEVGHVRVDATRDRVTMTTDGVAFLPSYWAVHDDALLISTHLSSLVTLGLPAATDPVGLVEYLALLHPLQQRTLLMGGSALPRGGLLRWELGAPAQVQAQPLFVPGDEPQSDEESIGSYRELWADVLRDVVERAHQDRLLQGLSGGLDSRAVAAGLAGIASRPLAYTYGTLPTWETSTASQVARELGLAHVHVPVTPDRMLSGFADVAARLDGAHSASEMYETWFGDLLRSLGNVVVNGLSGGPLWGNEKAAGLSDRDPVEAKIWSRYQSSLMAVLPFLAAPLRHDAEGLLRASLRQSMEPWDFSARTDMPVFWQLANRQLRWGGMLVNALRRDGLRLEAPFLDSRFLRFCANLTPGQRLNGRLYLRVHRELFSATSAIPRSDDGNSPDVLDHVYWSAETSVSRQLLRLARRHPMSSARRLGRHGAESGAALLGRHARFQPVEQALTRRTSSFPAALWLRTEPLYSSRLAAALETGAGCAEADLLDADAVADAAAALHDERPSGHALVLGRLATAGLWLGDHQDRERRRSD